MTRKNVITIILILFIIVIAGLVGGYVFLTNTKTTVKNNEGGFGSLPVGDNTNKPTPIPTSPVDSNSNASTSAPSTVKLHKITQTPVAGFDFINNNSYLWYVDRGNGNIFEVDKNSLQTKRITKTTLPKIYEAYIEKDGKNVIYRSFNEDTGNITTFFGSIQNSSNNNGTSSDQTKDIVGTYTADQITNLALSPTKDRFFGVIASPTGKGMIYTSASAKGSNLISSPITDWISQWINPTTLLMTTAPSSKTQSLSYFFNINNRSFSKVLGPKNGLVALASPDASHVIYSTNVNNTLVLSTLNTKTNAETTVSKQTIPDKCVWSKKDTSMVFCAFPITIPAGLYPDAWYQGKVVFNDTLGALDTSNGQLITLSSLGQSTTAKIDAIDLTLSPDEKHLAFINKNDLTLWILDLE